VVGLVAETDGAVIGFGTAEIHTGWEAASSSHLGLEKGSRMAQIASRDSALPLRGTQRVRPAVTRGAAPLP
jgi:hypothetical protein